MYACLVWISIESFSSMFLLNLTPTVTLLLLTFLKFLISYIIYRLKGNDGGVSYQLSYREHLTTHMQTIHDQYLLISGLDSCNFLWVYSGPRKYWHLLFILTISLQCENFDHNDNVNKGVFIKDTVTRLKAAAKWNYNLNIIQNKKVEWNRVTVQNYVEKWFGDTPSSVQV